MAMSNIFFNTSGPPNSNYNTPTNPSLTLLRRLSSHVLRIRLADHAKFSTEWSAPYVAYYAFDWRIVDSSTSLKDLMRLVVVMFNSWSFAAAEDVAKDANDFFASS